MFNALKTPVPPATTLSKFTTLNGVIYVATGALFWLYPYAVEHVGHPTLTPDTAGALRGVGIAVMYIGSFYIWGARSRFVPISLSSVVNRVFLGPVLILPLVFLKLMEPTLGIPFALFDFVMGIAMYLVWKFTQGAAHD